jgi:hypothetical protein
VSASLGPPAFGAVVREHIRVVLGSLDGAEIYGGCDYCDAYQELKPGPIKGVWILAIYHDDCRFFAETQS